ncbi:hypothetical protein ACWEQJ_37110, partial [Streptomyces cyaneofuscatus]
SVLRPEQDQEYVLVIWNWAERTWTPPSPLELRSQKLGQAMYANAQAEGATPGAEAPGDAQGKADDDVVDAEIVDDEKDTKGGAA